MAEQSTSPSRNRLVSALGGIVIGLALAVAGGVFCALMWRTYGFAREMDSWREVPCEILESRVAELAEVPNTPVSYQPVVVYRYVLDGTPVESRRVKRVPPKSSQREKMEELIAPFPAGTAAVCWVDPRQPTESVLVRDGKYPVYSIWFPALFVVGGLGLAVTSLVGNLRRS